MRRTRQYIVVLAAMLALNACEVQSDIQGKYVDTQSDCRDRAEDQMDAMPAVNSMSAKQRNAALVDKFSTCMIKQGWHVARPVKNPVVPTPPGTVKNPEEAALPAQPLPGQPSNVITAASPAQPAKESSPPNEPVKTQPNMLQPAPGAPALNEPAAPMGGQRPAMYEPSYAPAGTPSPGRQF